MRLRHLLFSSGLAAVLCSGAGPAAAQPAELFFKNDDMRDVVLSPSGSKLAILTNQGTEREALAVLDVVQGKQASRIALFPDGDIRSVCWLSEDKLVFTVVREDDGPDKYGSPAALYAVNSDGSSMRKLWSGHHSVQCVPASSTGQATERVLMAISDDRGEAKPVWLDLQRASPHPYENLNAPPHATAWFADSRGEVRVALTRHEGETAAYWRGPGSANWTQLYETRAGRAPFVVKGVDDAGGLYVTQRYGPEGYRWLTRYDFKAGKPEDRPIIKTPGFDFEGRLINLEGRLQGVRFTVDGESTYWFDASMRAFQDRVDRIFPDRMNRIDCRRCGAADMVAVVRSFSDHEPGKFYLYQAGSAGDADRWRPIGAVRANVQPEQMASVTLTRIAARDGRELPVWVTRPDTATGPLPAVVLVHGGPWARGSEWSWQAMEQFLASRGYVVVEPEMRGSDGYGVAHFQAGLRQWGRAMQDDVVDALKWAQAQSLATDKACIAGDSYGGYSTLMGLINDPTVFRCGIAGFAPTDLELFIRGSMWVADDVSLEGRKYELSELIGDPDKDAAMIDAESPDKQAARIKAPLMLIYGERDRRVPLTNGKRMRDALRDAGNDPVWVTYFDEGHGLYYLENRVDRAQRMEAFLAKYLK